MVQNLPSLDPSTGWYEIEISAALREIKKGGRTGSDDRVFVDQRPGSSSMFIIPSKRWSRSTGPPAVIHKYDLQEHPELAEFVSRDYLRAHVPPRNDWFMLYGSPLAAWERINSTGWPEVGVLFDGCGYLASWSTTKYCMRYSFPDGRDERTGNIVTRFPSGFGNNVPEKFIALERIIEKICSSVAHKTR